MGERSFPEKKQTQHNERDVDEGIAEQEHVQDTAGIFAEKIDERAESGMMFLQAANLVRFE